MHEFGDAQRLAGTLPNRPEELKIAVWEKGAA
jgi:hypothetical protein